jgi:hypothetical protein
MLSLCLSMLWRRLTRGGTTCSGGVYLANSQHPEVTPVWKLPTEPSSAQYFFRKPRKPHVSFPHSRKWSSAVGSVRLVVLFASYSCADALPSDSESEAVPSLMVIA